MERRKDEKTNKKLRDIGLDEKESLIYEYLLYSGGAFPSRIAKETGVNRSTTYKVLTTLSTKGLVNEIERRKKLYYQISSPNNLLRMARRGVNRAEKSLEITQTVLPDINSLYASIKRRPKILYFEGKKEILELYEDHVNTKKKYEMRALVGIDDVMGFLPSDFYKDYVRKKENLKITTRSIMQDTKESRNFLPGIYKFVDKKYWPEIKYINREETPVVGELTLYRNNRVSIVSLEKNSLVGVIIVDKTIYNMFSLMFELSWSHREKLVIS